MRGKATRDEVEITVRFPARLQKQEQGAFADPHATMQCEADEQYALLVELQKADSQFNDILYEYHYQKQYVEGVLAGSKIWRHFVNQIYKQVS